MLKEFDKKILRIVSISFALLGFIVSGIPIFQNLYNIGCVFLQSVFLIMAFFAFYYGRIQNGKLKVLMNIVFGIFVVGFLYCCFCLFQILSAQGKSNAPENTTVIVLGSRVYESGVGRSFKERLDIAYDYLLENEEAICITTGGQGHNEPCPEGEAGRDYLIEKGIDKDRIKEETTSNSTWQNLDNSMKIIEEMNLPKDIIISTQGFHQFRSHEQAYDIGYENTYSLVAYTNPMLIPAYYGREIMSLTKYYLLKVVR